MINLFDKAILSTQNVPQLEKVSVPSHPSLNFENQQISLKAFFQFVLDRIYWAETSLLESVGEHEPPVEELRDTIRLALNKALIPMKAYAVEYDKYLELMNLDINKYIK